MSPQSRFDIGMPDFSRRSEEPELMDRPGISPGEFEKGLEGLERVNALLGGHRTSLEGVEALVGADRTALSILDVGCGGGDFSRMVARWARRHGIDLYVLGIDTAPAAVEYSRWLSRDYPNLEYRRRDLFDLSRHDRFDVVHASLMLHHLDGVEAVEGLRKLFFAANVGVVINDLHRHPASYYASRLVLPLLSRSRLVRHDGPLSVLRAFRREELQHLVKQAGLPGPEIGWRPFFRWLCLLRREEE